MTDKNTGAVRLSLPIPHGPEVSNYVPATVAMSKLLQGGVHDGLDGVHAVLGLVEDLGLL